MSAVLIGMVLIVVVALVVISLFTEDDDDDERSTHVPRHREPESRLDDLLD